MRNLSRGLSLGGVSMMPLYRIKIKFCDSVNGSWSAGSFSGFGGVGIANFSFLACLGGINSVVTFFLRRGGYLARVIFLSGL